MSPDPRFASRADDEGASAVEYGLLLMAVAVVVVLVVLAISGHLIGLG